MRTVAHIPTGFAALDAITGCGGVPLGAFTLLSGRSTSGKLTLAYKLLANAQRPNGGAPHTVGLLDLSRTADPDYVHRCGVDLAHLLVGRPPPSGAQAVHLLGDLVQHGGVRALVVDSLADLAAASEGRRSLYALLPRLSQMLRTSGAALVVLDEPHAAVAALAQPGRQPARAPGRRPAHRDAARAVVAAWAATWSATGRRRRCSSGEETLACAVRRWRSSSTARSRRRRRGER